MKVIKVGAVWCGSCLIMKKIFSEVESEFPNISFKSLDLDFDKEEVEKYEKSNIIPYIIFTDDNDKEIYRLTGDSTKEEIISAINKNM